MRAHPRRRCICEIGDQRATVWCRAANVAWNAISGRDGGFSFDDSRYPRYKLGGTAERKGVAGANCARDRENKLSPVATTSHPRAPIGMARDTGCGKVGRDERPVSSPETSPSFFFPSSSMLSQHACARIFSYRGEPCSLPFHLALPGTCDDSLSPLQSLRLHIDCRYLEHVASSLRFYLPRSFTWNYN